MTCLGRSTRVCTYKHSPTDSRHQIRSRHLPFRFFPPLPTRKHEYTEYQLLFAHEHASLTCPYLHTAHVWSLNRKCRKGIHLDIITSRSRAPEPTTNRVPCTAIACLPQPHTGEARPSVARQVPGTVKHRPGRQAGAARGSATGNPNPWSRIGHCLLRNDDGGMCNGRRNPRSYTPSYTLVCPC